MRTVDAALLRKLDTLRLTIRRVQWGRHFGGPFVISRRGSSLEFADYSAYTPGDDIRFIDWNLYARSDRLFVKTYHEEVELSVELLIDATTSMGLPTTEKFERAIQLGLCLAHVGVMGRHHVRLSWITDGPPQATPWASRRTGITRLAEACASVTPSTTVTLSAWMQRAVGALRVRGGQVILLSDCLYRLPDWFRAITLLLNRHVEVKVIQLLTPRELDPARLFRGGVVVDSETGLTHELAYRPEELARAMEEHTEQLVRFCKRHGVLFLQHRLDESLEVCVLKTLPARGFLE